MSVNVFELGNYHLKQTPYVLEQSDSGNFTIKKINLSDPRNNEAILFTAKTLNELSQEKL